MAPARTFELNNDPLQDIAATLDVVGTEELLGSPGRRLPIKHGEVSLGRPQVYRLEPSAETASRLVPAPDAKPWRFSLVVFPFTLHPLAAGNTYEELTVAVSLTNPAVTAFDLIPDRVVDEREHQRTVKIGFKLPLKLAEAEAGVEDEIVLKDIRPVITAFGIGESRFYWRYTNSQGVELGAKRVAVILQLPSTINDVTAAVSYELVLKRRLFGFSAPISLPTRTEPWTVALALK
jgi:hypothetical protein